MNEWRYCLKSIIIDKLLFYVFLKIFAHSYSSPCLQDVWPAKQTACETGLLILFPVLTNIETGLQSSLTLSGTADKIFLALDLNLSKPLSSDLCLDCDGFSTTS